MLVGGFRRVSHLHGLRRLVERKRVRLRLVGTQIGSGAEAGDDTTENEITSQITTIHTKLLLKVGLTTDRTTADIGRLDAMVPDSGKNCPHWYRRCSSFSV